MNIIEYTDKRGISHRVVTEFFLQRAFTDMLLYQDMDKVCQAVELGLPELWDSVAHRTMLAEQIQHPLPELNVGDYSTPVLVAMLERSKRGHKGYSPDQQKRNNTRNRDLWAAIHYWHGVGLPIWDKNHKESTACAKAADGKGLSPESTHKVYLKMGKSPVSETLKFIAELAYKQGALVDNK